MNVTTSKLLNNQYVLKKYNNDVYKLVYFNNPRLPCGFERESSFTPNNITVNTEKLKNHISRARNMVFEYSLCNEFDYFLTLTLDPRKYDRYNLKKFIKDLGQWLRDMRKKTKKNIQYLLIPEMHKDGAWHIHGLIKGICIDDLEEFSKKDVIPKKIKRLIDNGRVIYDWLPYSKKFGYCTLEEVKNLEAISKYITKYINKDIEISVTDRHKKSYYCSRGLKKAEMIKKGTFPFGAGNALAPSFINKYVTLFDLDSKQVEALLQAL